MKRVVEETVLIFLQWHAICILVAIIIVICIFLPWEYVRIKSVYVRKLLQLWDWYSTFPTT